MVKDVEKILFMLLASRRKFGMRYFNRDEKRRYNLFWIQVQELYKNKPCSDLDVIKSIPSHIPAPFRYANHIFVILAFSTPILLTILFYKMQFDLFFSTLFSMMSVFLVAALNFYYRAIVAVRQNRLIDALTLIRNNAKKVSKE